MEEEEEKLLLELGWDTCMFIQSSGTLLL